MAYQPIDVFYYSGDAISFDEECNIIRPSGQTMQEFFNGAKSSKAPIVLFLPNDYLPINIKLPLQTAIEYIEILKFGDIATCDITIKGFDVIYPLTPKIEVPLFIKKSKLLHMNEKSLVDYMSKYEYKIHIPMVLFNYENN